MLSWHCRQGHFSVKYVQKLSTRGVDGISKLGKIITDVFKRCETCFMAKTTRNHYKRRERATRMLQLIYSDVVGLVGPMIEV